MTASPDAFALEADVTRLLGPDGVVTAPGAPPELHPDALVELHRAMVQQRAVDTAMTALRAAGTLRHYPAATGLEAAIFGPGWALNAQDWVFPAMREHGIARLRGATVDDLVAQCFGNLLDRARGRQLPGHLGAPGQQLASTSPPLATQLVHAAGTARGMQLGRSNAVALAYLGAAATCTSDFHAACHLAGRERLPVVFVCIRNMGAPVELAERTMAKTVSARVLPYRIAASRVDGGDVLACYAATRDAVARARRGEGPSFIEALAWRLEEPAAAATTPAWAGWGDRIGRGAAPSAADPGPTAGAAGPDHPLRATHRDTLPSEWDPLVRLEAWGLAAGWLDREQLAHARATARAEVEDVVAIMRVQDPPAASGLGDDVYAVRPWSLEAQLAKLQGV